jgi:hypothetical protein
MESFFYVDSASLLLDIDTGGRIIKIDHKSLIGGERIKFEKAWGRTPCWLPSQKFQSSLFPNESWSVLCACAYNMNPISNIVQFGVLRGSMERIRLLPASLGNQNKHRFLPRVRPCISPNRLQFETILASLFNPIPIYACVYTSPFIYIQYLDRQREGSQPWPIHPSNPGCPHKTTGRPTRQRSFEIFESSAF